MEEQSAAVKTEIYEDNLTQEAHQHNASGMFNVGGMTSAQVAEMHAATMKLEQDAGLLTPTECDEDVEPLTVLSSDDSDASIFDRQGRFYASDCE